jgi:hypothetical protein
MQAQHQQQHQQQQQQMRPQANAPPPQQQQPHKQQTQQQLPGTKQYDFQGARKRAAPSDAGPGSNGKPWVSNKAAKRAAASAPLVPMSGPVVVRPAATAEEAAEIEAWKAERRKHWPSAANTSKKVSTAAGLGHTL